MADIVIRVIAGMKTGYGHLVRMIALAHAFRELGKHVTFITNERHQILLDEGFYDLRIVPDSEDGLYWEHDERVYQEIAGIGRFIFVGDSYLLTDEYLSHLRPYSRLLCAVDDYGESLNAQDILLNGNIYAESLYEKRHSGRVLAGSQYCLLRKSFSIRKSERKCLKGVESLLLMMGGSDPRRLTLPLIRALTADNYTFKTKVIIQRSHPDLRDIANSAGIELFISPRDIAEIMNDADIAITAAGSSLYELACLGVPSISIIVADNQKLVGESCEAHGFSVCLGNYQDYSDEALRESIERLSADPEMRNRMSEAGRLAIDGLGAIRMAAAILGQAQEDKQ